MPPKLRNSTRRRLERKVNKTDPFDTFDASNQTEAKDGKNRNTMKIIGLGESRESGELGISNRRRRFDEVCGGDVDRNKEGEGGSDDDGESNGDGKRGGRKRVKLEGDVDEVRGKVEEGNENEMDVDVDLDLDLGREEENEDDKNENENAEMMEVNGENEGDDDEEDDEDEVWEEIVVPETEIQNPDTSTESMYDGPSIPIPVSKTIEITVTHEAPKMKSRLKFRGIKKSDRLLRSEIHKLHLSTLLTAILIRNNWCNDPEIQALCVSLVPETLFNHLQNIDGTRGDNLSSGKGKGKAKGKERERVNGCKKDERDERYQRMLNANLKSLVKWFKDYFECTNDYYDFGSTVSPSSNPSNSSDSASSSTSPSGTGTTLPISLSSRLASPAVLSLLFCTLCRALHLRTRLVGSVHPIALNFKGEGLANVMVNERGEEVVVLSDSDDQENGDIKSDDQEDEKNGKEKGKEKGRLVVVKGGKSRGRGHGRGRGRGRGKGDVSGRETDNAKGKGKLGKPNKSIQSPQSPPCLRLWVEVYHPLESKWISIDPVKADCHCQKSIENSICSMDPNGISYVVGFEADSTIKDLTPRYTSTYLSKSLKNRVDEKWWGKVLKVFNKSDDQARDEDEEEKEKEELELEQNKLNESMPGSIGGFKGHPLYVLERHLKKYETIHPKLPVLGHVRGEPVYPRANVQLLNSSEGWLKQGRVVKSMEDPVKHIKSRSTTTSSASNSKDSLNALNEGTKMVPLFGYWQTEKYQPLPIVNGKIPTNEYGKVELFTKEMCPIGGVHLDLPNIATLAKRLSIPFAPALTGFEYKSRRCIPVVSGIIVPIDYQTLLEEAWHEKQVYEEDKMVNERLDKIWSKWKRIVKGVLVRERLKGGWEVEKREEVVEEVFGESEDGGESSDQD